MFLAHVYCSDHGCVAEADVCVDDLDELDGIVCDCGYGFILVRVATMVASWCRSGQCSTATSG